MSETLEELLDEDMGDMGDVEDIGLELDLDEDALLADDNDESLQNTKENKTIEDEDFIEIGIEDDISDDLKNDDDKKARIDENERNKERSRFKTERNITSLPRNNSIPETLDAVPVKSNYTQNNQRGKRPFRGGPRGRHRGGGPQQHFHYPPQQQPSYQPMPQYSSGNIHVNPHFRNNFNLPGGGMWNGWNQEHPRPMMAQPNYNDQSWGRWNDNQPMDHQYQHHPDQDYYNNGSNNHNYQNNFQPPHPPSGWEQPFYHQDEYHQPYQPHVDQQYRTMGNNVQNFYPQPPPPQNFHGNMPPPFNSPPRNKFPRGGGIHRGVPKPGILSIKNKGQTRDNYMQNKAVLKQQRFDALRKVTISNLHEVELNESPEKKPKIEETIHVEEDEEMRAYRLKIEEQKKLREELLRQKEEKRKVTAQQKNQLLEAGSSSEQNVENDQSEFKVVRVRTPDGKTVLKKLTISEISKLKKVHTSNNTNNGVEPKPDVVSKIVAIDNLSASTTKKQLETMAKQIGPFENIKLDAESKKAVITFTSEESALLFKNRYQHKMVDLSMISVRLIPED